LAVGDDSTSCEIVSSYVPLGGTSVSSVANEYMPVVGASLVVDDIVGDVYVGCSFGSMLLQSGSGSFWVLILMEIMFVCPFPMAFQHPMLSSSAVKKFWVLINWLMPMLLG
jgi:hypothetical protein